MKLSPDDPRLTAYALGEMDDPAEAMRIETAVAASPELREAVADIRATAAALEKALAGEEPGDLSEKEKEAIHAAAATAASGESRKSRKVVFWPLLSAAAAMLFVAFLLAPSITSLRDGDRRADVADPRIEVTEDRHAAEAAPEADRFADEDRLAEEPMVAAESQPEPEPEPMLEAAPTRQRFGEAADMAEPMPRPAPARSRTMPATRAPHDPAVGIESFRHRTEPWNTDAFDPIEEGAFRSPLVAPLSTFAIDVDTASYSVVRSHLNQGRLPPPNAVRIEELINYFPYSDASPETPVEEGGDPFAVHTEQAAAPWAPEHRLLRVNLKGYEVPWEERPPSNLVFLIDVSGSMDRPNRLPLVKDALGLLVERLDERDRVAIVVYAGNSNLTLPSTTANNRETIRHAIDQLVARGSTHASDGIQRAYKIARKHFVEDGNNRVILCTDGDFNVGITDRGELGEFVKKEADNGISLTVLGFGMGNYKDNMLEYLSTKGSGIYGYIDSEAEARKFFLEQIAGNLFTIARDVRIQVELNPSEVAAYRLIGYENRVMAPEDFNDDTKRAGQIGPGHTVTAFYEIVPQGVDLDLPGVDDLRYQAPAQRKAQESSGELATVKVRYKRPGEEESELIAEHVSPDAEADFDAASSDFRFGASVAAFGMRLRGSEHIGDFDWPAIRGIAREALTPDPGGYRTEFLNLIDRAETIADGND